MSQSVYNQDFRDPKEYEKLTQRLIVEKLKSNLSRKNSICALTFPRQESSLEKSEIDFSTLTKKRQERDTVAGKKLPHYFSSTKIISCCQDGDKNLWKLNSAQNGTFREIPKYSGGVAMEKKTKDSKNVTKHGFIIQIIRVTFSNIPTADQHKDFGILYQQLRMLRKSDVQFPLH